jgi:hypothetical protein
MCAKKGSFVSFGHRVDAPDLAHDADNAGLTAGPRQGPLALTSRVGVSLAGMPTTAKARAAGS